MDKIVKDLREAKEFLGQGKNKEAFALLEESFRLFSNTKGAYQDLDLFLGSHEDAHHVMRIHLLRQFIKTGDSSVVGTQYGNGPDEVLQNLINDFEANKEKLHKLKKALKEATGFLS